MEYKDYLEHYKSNSDIFKSIEAKDAIINNPQKCELTWFCGDNEVTSQMIYDLLDTTGIQMLSCCEDRLTKINGIIACGKDISKLFDNDLFSEMLLQLNDYYNYLKEDEAVKFIDFVINKNPNVVVKVFNNLSDEAKLSVLSNCDLSVFYYQLLHSSKCVLEYVLDKIPSLNGVNYEDLLYVFDKVQIPGHLLKSDLIKKIITMYNVKAYRHLIDKFGHYNDTSEFESSRRKFYEYFLSNSVDIYSLIKRDVDGGKSLYESINEHLNCFGGFDSVVCEFFSSASPSDSIDTILKKSFNYITTDIVVDYLFHDFAYNVFIDIKGLINFNSKTQILSDESLSFYSKIISLDQMSIDEKLEFLNKYKNDDIVSMFYDDWLCARRKMTNLINSSILTTREETSSLEGKEKLTSNNISKFKNEELSKQYGVPIYELNGEDFYVLVRSTSKGKHTTLEDRDLDILCDGVSYSIDGSGKLALFKDPKFYYNIAYDGIPTDQLVHVFEEDSYSRYRRSKDNIPYNDNGTGRVNRLFVPEDLIGASRHYSELVISQPRNSKSKSSRFGIPQFNKVDEFNFLLSLPRAFAIYCYDVVSENDIKSAKDKGLGIIVVRTEKYNTKGTDMSGMFTTSERNIKYFNPSSNEDTWNRNL